MLLPDRYHPLGLLLLLNLLGLSGLWPLPGRYHPSDPSLLLDPLVLWLRLVPSLLQPLPGRYLLSVPLPLLGQLAPLFKENFKNSI